MKKEPNDNAEGVRLDKWLWAARLYKTRSLAREAIQAGKVQYNQQRSKPSKLVEIGAILKVPQGHDQKEIIIRELFDRRRSAKEVTGMYDETAQSIVLRERNQQARRLNLLHNPHPEHKPDKKQRRQIIRLKTQ